MNPSDLRNIAIIAHVDHGKTTLIDKLLQQSGTLGTRKGTAERVMDSNALEQERGITILAKNTALKWQDADGNTWRINIVDTPGHADFGGEVERVLSMVDSVLLLVDAVEGPMPQTRFVTQKAFQHNLNPIVVINKVDRPGARPDWVINQVFELFDNLGASEEQLDFPIVYASAINGYATLDNGPGKDMNPLFQMVIDRAPPPKVDIDAPLQLQVSQLDYSNYLGVIGIGRIKQGKLTTKTMLKVIGADGKVREGKLLKILGFHGLERVEVERAEAGDIVAFCGLDPLKISDTLCDLQCGEALPPLTIDQPTISMTFCVNDSPFAGTETKTGTSSRRLQERLMQELLHNVALKVELTDDPEKFIVSGRGELHLGILIENMRREGYELAVSRPEVIIKTIDGEKQEPYEDLTVDIESTHQGIVMEKLGERRGELKNMLPNEDGRVRLEYVIPARGLIGLQTQFLTATSGTGLLYHSFSHYGPYRPGSIGQRDRGVLIVKDTGKALGYALFTLQMRGSLFIGHGTAVYEGMVIGINSRSDDMLVNPLKGKQLTNIRAAGTDENIILTPPIVFSLEEALEFIDTDELVEITPLNIRIRKKFLKPHERKKLSRGTA